MIIISIPLVSVLISVVAVHTLQKQRDQLTEMVRRATQAGTLFANVNAILLEAESATRGYLITQDPQYLEPLRRAERELPQRMNRLRGTLSDSSTQLARVERASALSQQRLEALRSMVDKGAAADRLAHSRALGASLQQEIGAMAREEGRRWVLQTAQETALRKRLSRAVNGGAVLSLLAGGLAMGLFLTGIVRRSHLLRENADRLALGQPVADAAPGADELGQVGAALARSSLLLSEREAELRNLNQELDQRVKDRTAELAKEVAERQKSEERLRHVQKMEAIGQLAGGVAHDFNNLLTVILGFGESLGEKLPPVSAARADLDQMMLASLRAATLTRQLLAFSRRQIIRPQVVDLNTVLARTGKFLSRLIGENIELQTVAAPRPVKVRVDEGQIEQVLMNLAVNARDAMPTGGKLTIRMEEVALDQAYCDRHLQAPPGAYVMIAVSDTGEGISAEVRARIFEPFFTTKDIGKGTGLGLSTVYGIVKQNGGDIWVYSEPGLGTTFKIYLPEYQGEVETVAPAPVPAIDVSQPATILLVEDEPAVRRITRQILTSSGFTVLTADGPDSARSICGEHPGAIQLLLTDVIMPKTNGRQLAQELQAKYPEMKVLYMSGYTDDIITKHGVLDKGTGFIEKPFTPKALIARVREVMVGMSAASQ
jgi:signal transduction histidine kinase